MIEISLCMIVKNEESILGRCLESVKDFADEIIIVDTGSTDKTKEVATRYGAKLYDFEWCDDFGKARNFSFSKATKDFIFWLDADDYITEENLQKMWELKEELTLAIDTVTMHYSLVRDTNGNTTYSLRRNRLVKRSLGFLWRGRIHEYLEVFGRTMHSDISIYHDKQKPHTQRNIAIFKLMEQEGEVFSDRDLFYYANELFDHKHYAQAIDKYIELLERETAWVEDLKTATLNLVQCLTLTNQEERKIKFILNTFKWGVPRADIVCQLAAYYMGKGDYISSVFWYKTALKCRPQKDYMGVAIKDYYTWIPTMQLCVCYAHLEKYKEAYYYNEMAALYRPNASEVEHNRKYLENQFKKTKQQLPLFKTILVEDK